MNGEKLQGYGKKPMWQWILLYLVIGGIVYAIIYYLVGSGSTYMTPLRNNYTATSTSTTSTTSIQATPAPTAPAPAPISNPPLY